MYVHQCIEERPVLHTMVIFIHTCTHHTHTHTHSCIILYTHMHTIAIAVPQHSALDLPELWYLCSTLVAQSRLQLHPDPVTRAGQETEMRTHSVPSTHHWREIEENVRRSKFLIRYTCVYHPMVILTGRGGGWRGGGGWRERWGRTMEVYYYTVYSVNL